MHEFTNGTASWAQSRVKDLLSYLLLGSDEKVSVLLVLAPFLNLAFTYQLNTARIAMVNCVSKFSAFRISPTGDVEGTSLSSTN
jgi:hypothetical protein